jgi:hypothetical protein
LLTDEIDHGVDSDAPKQLAGSQPPAPTSRHNAQI